MRAEWGCAGTDPRPPMVELAGLPLLRAASEKMKEGRVVARPSCSCRVDWALVRPCRGRRPGNRLAEDSLRGAYLAKRGIEVFLSRFLAVVNLLAVYVDLEPSVMDRRECYVGLLDSTVTELGRHTGGRPEIASGDAVFDLQFRFADHASLLR